MIDLRTPLRDYLALRRQLGFELKEAGAGLEDFVGFLERAGAERLTTELAVKPGSDRNINPSNLPKIDGRPGGT